jgi:hypothetical protein
MTPDALAVAAQAVAVTIHEETCMGLADQPCPWHDLEIQVHLWLAQRIVEVLVTAYPDALRDLLTGEDSRPF